MRTNVVIDDDLMSQALKFGYKTKKKAINEGLKLLVQKQAQVNLKKYKGKVSWEGDLEKMRSN